MSFFDRFKRSVSEPISQEDFANYLRAEDEWTGINVDRSAAIGISAVWSAVRLLSESVASLPLFFYRRTEKGKDKAIDNSLYRMMWVQPNPIMSSFQLRELMQYHLLFYGNAYAQKLRGSGSQVVELWPLTPDKIRPYLGQNNKRFYEYQKGNDKIILNQDEVFHIPGLGFDGIMGYAPLVILMQQFGYSIAVKRYGSEFFKNGGVPGGYLALPNRLRDDDARKRLAAGWHGRHGEWGNKHSTAILEEDAKYVPLNIPPEQAQFIESQKFSVTDIARVFRVPPHMIGDLDRATFSNIEQQSIDFVVNTLRPWLVRWEQEMLLQIIPREMQEDFFFEFQVNALLRGDFATRAAGYRTFIEMGVMSPNEVRNLENLNAYEDGDEHFIPLNLVPITDAGMDVSTEVPAEEQAPAEEDARSLGDREMRSAKSRQRLSRAYMKLFAQAFEKIATREGRDITEGVTKYLAKRGVDDFQMFIDKYYRGEFPDYLRKQLTPVYLSFQEAVRNEINRELNLSAEISPEDLKFAQAYLTTFISRYIAKSKLDLQTTLTKAVDNGADIGLAFDERLGEWGEVRPETTARNESTRGSNAFAKAFYIGAGVLYLRWVSLGESCPFCDSLDGKIVGTEGEFSLPNDELVAQGKTLGVSSSIGHPPIHRGCDCQIVAT
ncbi:MAG: phage portal protein [bacterium]